MYKLQVNIGLECVASHLKSLKKKFLRVSSQATITHLKKFIAVKVLDGSDKYRDVSKKLKVYSLKFVAFARSFLLVYKTVS